MRYRVDRACGLRRPRSGPTSIVMRAAQVPHHAPAGRSARRMSPRNRQGSAAYAGQMPTPITAVAAITVAGQEPEAPADDPPASGRRRRQPRPPSATCGLSDATTSHAAAARSRPSRSAMNASSIATVMRSDKAPWRKVMTSGGMASIATIDQHTLRRAASPCATCVSSRQPSQTRSPSWTSAPEQGSSAGAAGGPAGTNGRTRCGGLLNGSEPRLRMTGRRGAAAGPRPGSPRRRGRGRGRRGRSSSRS